MTYKNNPVANAYVAMYEAKTIKREAWVPESITDEDVADFMGAAAAAAKAGKKDFKFGDKTYKVTMKKDTAAEINDAVEVCEKCGKVHEGSCSAEKVEEAAQDPNADKKEKLEPRAKGEKDFKDMHDDNVEVYDEEEGEKKNAVELKKSAEAAASADKK